MAGRGDPCDRPCSVGDQDSGEDKIRPDMRINNHRLNNK